MTKRNPQSPGEKTLVSVGLTFGEKLIRMSAPVEKFECSEEAPGGRTAVALGVAGQIVHIWRNPDEFFATVEAGIAAQRRAQKTRRFNIVGGV